MLLLLLIALGAAAGAARGETRRVSYFATFPGHKLAANESLGAGSVRSLMDCGAACLRTALCVAANYDTDAGVCHMLARPASHSMEASSSTTAIRTALAPLPWLGLWPLQAAYGEDDLSAHAHHLSLGFNVTFLDDGVTPWASPAAHFPGSYSSYAHLLINQDLASSYSWMAKVYPIEDAGTVFVTNGPGFGFYQEIWMYSSYYGVWKIHDQCTGNYVTHPAQLSLNTWHTLAVTFHAPTRTFTAWMDEERHVSTPTYNICENFELNSTEIYIGYDKFHGRISCVGYFSDVVDYAVMYDATMLHCSG